MDSNKHTVTYRGENYSIDLDKAKDLGLLKKKMPTLKEGACYRHKDINGVYMVIKDWKDKFSFLFFATGGKFWETRTVNCGEILIETMASMTYIGNPMEAMSKFLFNSIATEPKN